jgi:hypothetical protein
MRMPQGRFRSIALAVCFGVLAAACTGGSKPAPPTPTAALGPPCDAPTTPQPASPPPAASGPTPSVTIDSLSKGARPLVLLSSDNPVNPGKERFGFDLTTADNGLLTGGNPTVYLAKDRQSKAIGPFVAQWFPFTAYPKCRDRSPLSPLPGIYSATIDAPPAGSWFVAVTAQGEGRASLAVGDPTANPPTGLTVTDGPVPIPLGSKAISVKTPVATTEAGLRQIDTRRPPDHLHYISLDQALTNGKPTVVVFSTPLLCESRLCGPVTDEVILASQQIGGAKANFIHVEEFLPGPDLKPPPPTLENQSPGFKAWHLHSEPWVVVIDPNGIIRAKFDGSVTAPEIEAALLLLL